MALTEYRKKRDFARTPEPAGSDDERASAGGLSFVVQKHDASRLHYDFRLEMEGVLRSWAVPKGPSLDPSERRLAVNVEDHPLGYGGFEGVIPEGQYGGGTVLLWDRGTWEPTEVDDPAEAYRDGKIKFTLHGEKLRGGWMLVRMGGKASDGGKNWLLVKERDDEALPEGETDVTEARPESVETGRDLDEIAADRDRVWDSKSGERPGEGATGTAPGAADPPEVAADAAGTIVSDAAETPGARTGALPSDPRPQLARLRDEAPSGDDWIHEIKYDGYRLFCRVEDGTAKLLTRRGKDWTSRFGVVARAAGDLAAESALLDGEAVVVLPDGTTDFQRLQGSLGGGEPDGGVLAFYAFDLLHLDGVDLSGSGLLERKRILRALLEASGGGVIRYSDHVTGKGPDFFARACESGLEGIICKRADAPYRPGRGRDWLKVKCQARQEFVVGGFTEPSGSRVGLGALLLGVHREGDLAYAGKVGTGFTDDDLRSLRSRLERLERKTPPFADPPTGADARDVHWTTPRTVVEVEFTEWTRDGQLRHPSFKGLRTDKPAAEVTVERPVDEPTAGNRPEAEGTAGERHDDTEVTVEGDVEVAGVRLSSPDRVLWPEQGATKLALARYYERVAEHMLPHVTGRPLSLVRCPRGQGEPCFYQKHPGDELPEAVGRVDIAEKKGTAEYVYVTSLAGLVALVQIGTLEVHGWGSRKDRVERPDRVIFDLDPDPGVDYRDVIVAARELRERLEALGLRTWVKTTGGKGVHVVAPLTRRHDFDEVKAFSKAVAQSMEREAPDRFTSNMSKKKRKGRIFVDYLRNGRGATAIAPYSTRARPGAPVAVPIRWDELDSVGPADHDVESVPRRLDALTEDPWEGFLDVRQSITRGARKAVGME